MLAIWSVLPLPFLNPAWTSGSSQFTNSWSLGWRILSMQLCGSLKQTNKKDTLCSRAKEKPNKMVKVKSESHSVVSNSLWSHGLYSSWNSPGQNTRVGSLSLLWGIVPTQVSNSGLPHCRQILYQLSHKRSPKFPPKGLSRWLLSFLFLIFCLSHLTKII